MAKPTPTAPQAAAINAQVASLNNQVTSLQASANAQNAIIAQNQLIDDAFKAQFNWYDQSVIGKYDAERKAINGVFPTNPVVEADILAVAANPPAGRLTPTPPTTDIVRVSDFDGTPTSSTMTNELQHLTDQIVPENYILVGFGGTSPTVSGTTSTTSAITPSSTTVNITDSASLPVFAIGNRFVIHDGVSSVVVQVTSVMNTTPDPGGMCSISMYTTQSDCLAHSGIWTPNPATPPYTFTLGITLIVPGSVGSGALLDATFTTFTNSERTTKIATLVDYQNIMNFLVAQIQIPINNRISRLNEELAALNTNDDPYGVANITTAKTNVNASKTFLTNYLITVDISNSGMSSLQSERISRTTQANARVTQINAAYTGETENFYNQRYIMANNRGNTSRGTLRTLSNAQNVKTVLNGLVATIGDQTAVLTSIL